jgi:cytoskeletal protein RodZ
LTELGNRLKQAREEKGMSLEDLQTATKIQKRYLIGIEEGNYAIMPGQFYARAFIKQYSEAVGLDPELIFEEYKQDIPANEKDEIPPLSRVKTRKQVPTKNNKVLNFIPKVFMFLAFVAVVAILYILFQNWGVGNSTDTQEDNNRGVVYDPATTDNGGEGEDTNEEKANEEEPAEEPEEEQVESSTGTLTEVSSNRPTATLELKDTDTFEVELSAKGGNTWVGISNSEGESFHSKELVDGETETFNLSEENEVIFNVGWVPATEIKINGKAFEFPFPVDEVTTQKVTIKFVSNGQQ